MQGLRAKEEGAVPHWLLPEHVFGLMSSWVMTPPGPTPQSQGQKSRTQGTPSLSTRVNYSNSSLITEALTGVIGDLDKHD